ncbi:nitroreductase [Salipiger abyssi]|uniref:nitroreductase n=1 Tax=Salipiger abyssi TaxID=1250539 RepID=UPI001A8E8906|nr:nitroreductase [Salipiger abyssi]MBN9887280.1 nitroreductase [Salipiger abyssi]
MSGGALDAVLRARRSVRAFRPDPVPREEVAELLDLARTAPSGANLQPGRFHVLAGEPLAALADALERAATSGRPPVSEYSYFPAPMPAEYKARQRAAGYALYSALGIARRDVAARRAQFARNYRFFDAPVGLVVTIDRRMGAGCFMDLGMVMQSFFLAAEGRGLGACGIGAIAEVADIAHAHLELPEEEMVVCGIALGHPDPSHPVNGVQTERLKHKAFASFRGF